MIGEERRAETAYPGVGRLAARAVPAAPRSLHDWQACRSAAVSVGRLDPASQCCPCGIGLRSAGSRPENCLVCGRPASVLTGALRPLAVLCPDCDADVRAVRASGQWREMFRPGHGLESLIGSTRAARGGSGGCIFDLTTVRPGYVPLALALVPPDASVHDAAGEVMLASEMSRRLMVERHAREVRIAERMQKNAGDDE